MAFKLKCFHTWARSLPFLQISGLPECWSWSSPSQHQFIFTNATDVGSTQMIRNHKGYEGWQVMFGSWEQPDLWSWTILEVHKRSAIPQVVVDDFLCLQKWLPPMHSGFGEKNFMEADMRRLENWWENWKGSRSRSLWKFDSWDNSIREEKPHTWQVQGLCSLSLAVVDTKRKLTK